MSCHSCKSKNSTKYPWDFAPLCPNCNRAQTPPIAIREESPLVHTDLHKLHSDDSYHLIPISYYITDYVELNDFNKTVIGLEFSTPMYDTNLKQILIHNYLDLEETEEFIDLIIINNIYTIVLRRLELCQK